MVTACTEIDYEVLIVQTKVNKLNLRRLDASDSWNKLLVAALRQLLKCFEV